VAEVNRAVQQVVARINYELEVDMDNSQDQTHNLDLTVFNQV